MASLSERWVWSGAAFVWGLAEATLFFIVPDVLLSFIALRYGLRSGLIACVSAAIGASLGGLIMHWWSAHDLGSVQSIVLALPAIDQSMLDDAWRQMVDQGWFMATINGPLTATPYKVYAILAPHIGAHINAFALASIAARLPRFLLVTGAIAVIAPLLKPYVSMQRMSLGLGGIWLLFYAIYWVATPW